MFVDVEAYPDVDVNVSSFKGILSPSLPWICFTHGRSKNMRPEHRKREPAKENPAKWLPVVSKSAPE